MEGDEVFRMDILSGFLSNAYDYVSDNFLGGVRYGLENPLLLLLIPAAAIVLWFIIRKTFIKFRTAEDREEFIKRSRWERRSIMILRIISVSILILALASPYYVTERTIKGDPHMTVLVDNSTSFTMFDAEQVEIIIDGLKKHLPVKVRYIGAAEDSNIGDEIINNIRGGGESVLLITDGWATRGSTLDNAFTNAAISGVTINAVDLKPVKSDVSVRIEGQSQNIIGLRSDFTAIVRNVGDELTYTLTVNVNGQELLQKRFSGSHAEAFSLDLPQGFHTIDARISGMTDQFSQNNEYLKTIQILPKPKVLFISTKQSPIVPILEENYNVDISQTIPDDINQYYATLLNDLPISMIAPKFETINNYVTNGDGLVVIGGKNSYDRGGYEGTLFETILPARIGEGVKSGASGVNVVIVIDASYSYRGDAIDYAKSLAVDIISNARPQDSVGVIAFRSGGGISERTNTVVDLTPMIDTDPYFIDRVINEIGMLRGGGGTDVYAGLGRAEVLLSGKDNVNLIIVSDGQQVLNRINSVQRARALSEKGFKIFTVGYSNDGLEYVDDVFLADIAEAGDGIYTAMDQPLPLVFIFEAGDEGEDDFEQRESDFGEGIIVYDSNHWIVRGVDMSDASVSGYNAIVPKKSARGILYTMSANNMLAAWQFGLGRVVAYGTDDGSAWSGPMLSGKSSELIPRMINWAITDPDRKERFSVDLYDTRVGQNTAIVVNTNQLPELAGYDFSKTGINEYTAYYVPDTVSFKDFFGYKQAVNYPLEYQDLGMNNHFLNLVRKGTYKSGRVFMPADIEGMVEKAKQDSEMIEPASTYLRWPLVLAALVVFLFEVCIRKMKRNKDDRKR